MSSCPTRTTREVTEETTSRPLRVVFVCLGNICRSPIAERVAERAAAEAGITGVEFSSAGTISEEYDDPMDHRAVAVLKERGYRYADHRARRITEAQIESADLVVAMEDVHLRSVLELRLIRAGCACSPNSTQPRCPDLVCRIPGLDPMRASTTRSPQSKQPCRVCSTASVSSKTPTPAADNSASLPNPLTGFSLPRCDAPGKGQLGGGTPIWNNVRCR